MYVYMYVTCIHSRLGLHFEIREIWRLKKTDYMYNYVASSHILQTVRMVTIYSLLKQVGNHLLGNIVRG